MARASALPAASPPASRASSEIIQRAPVAAQSAIASRYASAVRAWSPGGSKPSQICFEGARDTASRATHEVESIHGTPVGPASAPAARAVGLICGQASSVNARIGAPPSQRTLAKGAAKAAPFADLQARGAGTGHRLASVFHKQAINRAARQKVQLGRCPPGRPAEGNEPIRRDLRRQCDLLADPLRPGFIETPFCQ